MTEKKSKNQILRAYRKAQSALAGAGTGILMFSAWDIVFFLLYMLLNGGQIRKMISEIAPRESVTLIYAAVFSVSAVIIIIDVFIRFLLAREAIRYGRTGVMKRPKLFTVLSVYFGIAQIVTLADMIRSCITQAIHVEYITGILVGMASLFIFFELFISRIKVQRYEKQLKEMEA